MENLENMRLEEIGDIYFSETGRMDAQLITHYAFETVKHEIKGPSILFLGVGNALFAERLSKIYKDLTLVEGSKKIIDEVSESKNLKIEHSLFEEYRPRRKFDTVIGAYVLEHVKDPIGLIKLSHKWLKKKGKAIFTVPNADSLHRRIGVELGCLVKRDQLGPQDFGIGHRRVYTIGKLAEHLELGGFEVYWTQGFILKVLSNSQMAGWDQKILDAMYRVSLTLPPQYCSSLAAFCTRTDE
jgi:SAM-dependent methyltransferase